MLRTSGEILIGSPTGYNSGSSVQTPISRKMIRRSIFNMRSENVTSGPFPLPALHTLRVAPSGRPVARSGGPYTGRGCEHDWASRRQDPQVSLFPSAQIRAFDAENNFEGERDGAEADADENGPADRGIEHVQNPLGDIAAQRKQILTERYAAHHDDHRCHQQHS